MRHPVYVVTCCQNSIPILFWVGFRKTQKIITKQKDKEISFSSYAHCLSAQIRLHNSLPNGYAYSSTSEIARKKCVYFFQSHDNTRSTVISNYYRILSELC